MRWHSHHHTEGSGHLSRFELEADLAINRNELRPLSFLPGQDKVALS